MLFKSFVIKLGVALIIFFELSLKILSKNNFARSNSTFKNANTHLIYQKGPISVKTPKHWKYQRNEIWKKGFVNYSHLYRWKTRLFSINECYSMYINTYYLCIPTNIWPKWRNFCRAKYFGVTIFLWISKIWNNNKFSKTTTMFFIKSCKGQFFFRKYTKVDFS